MRLQFPFLDFPPLSLRRHSARATQLCLAVCTTLVALIMTGCGGLRTEYGETSGFSGRQSINGFGALRQAYETAGHKTHDVKRLSDRAIRNDVIVWVPNVLMPIAGDATDWFEDWLERGDRTLVFVLPDSGSEAEYWQQAARLAPPEQRLEYRRRAGRSINERMAERLRRDPISSNGWFDVDVLSRRIPVQPPSGNWSDEIPSEETSSQAAQHASTETGRPSSSFEENPIATELTVTPYKPPEGEGQQPKGSATPAAPAMTWPPQKSVVVSETETNFENLLGTEGGEAVVAKITSPQWKNSRVLVVSGGSLLTNFAFTKPANRRLAQRLIASSTPPQDSDLHAGFLETGWEGVSVAQSDPSIPRSAGMELLTVWPISLVTMHAALLGILACLMLLPIFGRPRHVRHREQSRFGDHLDAVAALMSRTGGEGFARQRISEYMRRVRGESSGPWVLPEATTSDTTGAPASRPAASTATAANSPQPSDRHSQPNNNASEAPA